MLFKTDSTFSLADFETFGRLCSTLSTVPTETPDFSAMSLILIFSFIMICLSVFAEAEKP